ncbi:MAG TPA: hypothetical protein PKN45_07275 [Candidatus Limiplasma sp.]|nr:hypothetical protein [Candidatus Limiplasma sp.]
MTGKKLLLWFILLVCALSALSCAIAEKETARYFYLNACESCHPEETFSDEFTRLTGKKLTDYQFTAYNVFQDSGREAYDQATKDWDENSRKLPLLIIGNEIYAGTKAIKTGLPVRFGKAAPDDNSRLYFITATACESCASARKTVDALPAIVPVEVDGQYVSSPVQVTEINISSDPDTAMALFERFAVPDGKRVAPCILFGDTWLSGEAEIRANLLTLLQNGRGLYTPQIEPAQAHAGVDQPITLLGAAAAGITAGFNPCALSMLLILAGALLSAKRRPLLYGTLYLAGKLAVYLGIGLAFAELWTRFAPPWFPLFIRILMTALGAGLIALNITDAISLRAEQYGKERNRLPRGLYNGLQSLIRRSVSRRGIGLSIAVIAVGMVTAAGEFFCAGQLYAAVLVANTQTGASRLPLVIYCLAFLVPSVAMLAAVSVSRRTLGSTDWVLKRLPVIKWVTAAVMAVLIVYTWVV